jgi:hypothetical protein
VFVVFDLLGVTEIARVARVAQGFERGLIVGVARVARAGFVK